MFKKFASIAAFALLTAAGTQAQTVNCSVYSYSCVVSGYLDADGFTVNIQSLNSGVYSMETVPFVAGQSNDTKITTTAGVLLADDELNRGYDRYICGTGTTACHTTIKVMPYSSPTNQQVRFVVTKLSY